MINHYYKENIDYNAQLTKFGKELLDIEKDVEIGEYVEEDQFNFKISKDYQDSQLNKK